MQNNWYQIKNIDTLDSPALVVYPQRVIENINTLISMVDDPKRLRPHIKTHKTKEGVQLMMAAGINKFKCATIAEAELLAMCQAPDVLLAYQPIGPKLQRLVQLTQQYAGTRFSCLTDNIASATAIAKAFASAGSSPPVYIDLNTGQNRTGIAPGQGAIDLYSYCAQLTGISMAGLHAYDGHIRGADMQARTAACNESYAAVEAMQQTLASMGFTDMEIVAGGSPSFPIHAKRKQVSCSPGTFIFWDKGYSDGCPEQPFQVAAMLATRVVSLPAPGLICIDLGHKSVAAENEITRRVFFPDAPHLNPITQSEEHLVLEAGEGHSFQPGDVLYGIPQHICPTVALYERMITVENGIANGEWKVAARNRKINL